MRFKIDENLPLECAQLLTAAEHDVVRVIGQNLQGADDPSVLKACVEEGRVLVTLDVDFADIRA